MAAEVEIVVNASVDAANNALLGTVRVFESMANIVTGIKSAFDLAAGAIDATVEFFQPFVQSASDSEEALARLDGVLRATAPGVGLFSETIGQLSKESLLGLYEQLDRAKSRLKEMGDELPPLKRRTEEQSLAFEVARDRVANLEAQIKMGTDGLVVYRDTTQLSRDAMIELADSLQRTTRFSDEVILSGEAILLTFRNLGAETFERTVPAMLDMAEIFGSVDSAAMQLGKALNDPVAGMTALSRAGVTFSAEQKEMIKNFVEMGDIASAQNIILSEVEAQIGGLAEAMGETFAGKVEIAKNRIDTFRETIGGAFLPVLKDMLDNFMEFSDSPMITNIENFFTRLTELLELDITPLAALGITFREFATIVPIFDEIGQGLLLMQSYMASGSNPLEALKNSLDDLAAAHPDSPLTGIITSIQDFLQTAETEGWGAAIGDVFSGLWEKINLPERISGLVDMLVDAISQADWTPVTEVFSEVIGGALRLAFQGLDIIVNETDWTPLGVSLKGAFEELMDGFFASSDISYKFGNWLNDIQYEFSKINWADIGGSIIDGIVSGIFGGVGDLLFTASVAFGMFVNRVKNMLGIFSPSAVFKDIGEDIVQGLIDGFVGYWANLITVAQTSLDNFLDLFGIDLSFGGTSAAGLGTAGGGTAGTTGGTTGGQTIINIYGASYWGVSGPGDVGGVYDCPSPNPLVASSGNQLVTTGF